MFPSPISGPSTINTGAGNDNVHISKAGGLAGLFGLYDVNINGNHQLMTKQQLENTQFNLGKGDDTLVVDSNVNASIHADGGQGDDLLIGGNGNDHLVGGSGDDAIYGRGGNDWLEGGKGNDFLSGGSGNDWISGGQGNDVEFGGSGNDVLLGGQGNDWQFGGSGNDVLVGGPGWDHQFGGPGFDFKLP